MQTARRGFSFSVLVVGFMLWAGGHGGAQAADPTDITLSSQHVAAGVAIGTVVGELSTADTDLLADTHTYALVSGDGDTDNAKFTIEGAKLKTAANRGWLTSRSI